MLRGSETLVLYQCSTVSMESLLRLDIDKSSPHPCLVPWRFVADSRAIGAILVPRWVSWETRSPFAASFASTLNVPLVHCAILIDRSQKSLFPFSKHFRRQGTRQAPSQTSTRRLISFVIIVFLLISKPYCLLNLSKNCAYYCGCASGCPIFENI